MARSLFVISLISVIAITTCDDSYNGNTTETSDNSGGNLLDEIGEIDDEQLWKLLKEVSRNGTISLGDAVYDYGDYSDVTESDTLETTESSTSVDISSDLDWNTDGRTSIGTEEISEEFSTTSEDGSTLFTTDIYSDIFSREGIELSKPTVETGSTELSSVDEYGENTTVISESTTIADFPNTTTTVSTTTLSKESSIAGSVPISTHKESTVPPTVPIDFTSKTTVLHITPSESVTDPFFPYDTTTSLTNTAITPNVTTTAPTVSTVVISESTKSTTVLNNIPTGPPVPIDTTTVSATPNISTIQATATDLYVSVTEASTFATTPNVVTRVTNVTVSSTALVPKIKNTTSSNIASVPNVSTIANTFPTFSTTQSREILLLNVSTSNATTPITMIGSSTKPTTVLIRTTTDSVSKSTTTESLTPSTDTTQPSTTITSDTKTTTIESLTPSTVTTQQSTATTTATLTTTIESITPSTVTTQPSTATTTATLTTTIESITPSTVTTQPSTVTTTATKTTTIESITPSTVTTQPSTATNTATKTTTIESLTTSSVTTKPSTATTTPTKTTTIESLTPSSVTTKPSTATTTATKTTTIESLTPSSVTTKPSIATTTATKTTTIESLTPSSVTTKPSTATTTATKTTTIESLTPSSVTTKPPTATNTATNVTTQVTTKLSTLSKIRTTTAPVPSTRTASYITKKSTTIPTRTEVTSSVVTTVPQVTTSVPSTTRLEEAKYTQTASPPTVKSGSSTIKPKKRPPTKKKHKPTVKPTSTTTTKPKPTRTNTVLPITAPPKYNVTNRPKVNKFDPKKLSVIGSVPDEATLSVATSLLSKGNQSSPTPQNKVNVFDSKKIFMIDQITEPPVVLKHKFDPSRKFGISEPAEDKRKVPSNIPPKEKASSPSQSIPRPSIHMFSVNNGTENTKIDENVERPEVLQTNFNVNQDTIQTNKTIPEVICFVGSQMGGKPVLKCIAVNPITKIPSAPFHVNIRSRPQYSSPEIDPPTIRRIFIKNRVYQGPAVVMNMRSVVPRNRVDYAISGNIYNSPRNGRQFRIPPDYRLNLNTPNNQIRITNSYPNIQSQQFVFQSGSSNAYRKVHFEHSPSLSVQRINSDYRPEPSPTDQFQVLIRHKRSATSGCNADNTIYDDDGHTLAFVFDNTGSMHKDLEQMRATAIEITSQMTGSKSNLIKDYVLVTFNDPHVAEPFCTTDYTEYLDKLQAITIHGGGDCPEMSLTGLEKALTVSRKGSFIFVITDAGAKDYHLEAKIFRLVMRKTPFIFYLLTGECPWPHNTVESAVYRNISQYSTGQVIEMEKMGVKEILEELNDRYVRKNLVSLQKLTNPKPAIVPYPVNVSVDGSLSEVTFTVAGSSPHINVSDPKGEYPPGEKKNFPNLISVHYKEPTVGVWKVLIGSSSPHSFSSTGISNTNFKVGFSVLPVQKVSETSHRPLQGGENYILVEVSNPEEVEDITSIELISLNEKSLDKIYLKKIFSSSNVTLYSGGPFIPPDEHFNMEMHGIGKKGEPVKRISPSAIVPQLPELPYITMLSHVEVEVGKTYTLKCHVESLVPVTVRMFKKTPRSKALTYNFKQTGDALFEFKNISLSEKGVYVCWAKNVAGVEQKDIEITVTVKPPKVLVEEEVFFRVDEQVVIPCNIDSPVPYTVLWKRGTGDDFYFVQNNSRTYYSDLGLIIERAQETDIGWYQCLVRNAGGESGGVSYLKPSVLAYVNVSPNQKYQTSFNVTLTCSANGIPPPELTWQRQGLILDTEKTNGRIKVEYLSNHIKINIINAQKEDEGVYTCVAQNIAGEVKKDTTLIYEEKPKVITNIIQAEIKAGEDISLPCQVIGIPVPEVVWTKDSIPVSPDTFSNVMVLSDNTLLIRQSTLAHSGLYKCQARNDVGFDEITIPIVVSGTKPKIIEPPEDIMIQIGGNGRLNCRVTGQPLPKIFWARPFGKVIRGVQNENSLELFNVSLSDNGEYWCTAENNIGKAEAKAFVKITGGVIPVINKVKDIEIIKVLVGEKAELECSIIGGNPYPVIEWFKDGEKLFKHLSNGIQLENGSYFISAVNPLDVGLYECIATNDLGKDVKALELKLHEPPKIDMNSSSNVVTIVGTTTRLKCPVTGDPPPKVSWRRYAHSNNKVMRGVMLEDSNDLVFENVSEADTGRYICIAENIAGTARRPFALQVMVPPKISSWPVEMLVESGNIFTLECRVRAIPRPSIFWFKDGESVPKPKYFGQFLRFYAKPEDSGTYSCIAENRAGKDQVETNLIVLVPPQIKDGPSTVKVISGSDAILPCEVSGNPQPFVAWQTNGELIKKEFGSEFGTLHLHNVTEADAGTYVCTAQNKAGTNKKKLELIVLTPPKVLPWTAPLKVILGELVNVTCQHFANPEAVIHWYKDKKPLATELVKDVNRIEFFVEPHHKGVYTCEAVNEAGIDSKDFLVVILDPPTFAQHLPFSVDVIRGKTIEIPCIAFGDPKPIMGWNRTDIILESNSKRIVNSETGVLTIINASPEDEGYYNCTAKNKAGEIWRTVEVNVLEFPTANLTVSKNIVKEGDVAEFNCHVTGNPHPKIYWKKDGKLLSTENDKVLRLIAHSKDSGNYTCVVKNSAGEDFSTIQLNVSVLPTIYGAKEETIVILEGEEIVLNCSAEGIPTPQVTWLFNGSYEGYSLIREKLQGPILRIKESKKENDGIFTCSAENFAGIVDKKFRVYIHVKPTITDDFNRQIKVLEGKDFSLPCNADGIPKPTVTWMKENEKLKPLSSLVSSPAVHDNILLIFNAQNHSEGSYTCLAENEAGVSTRNYTVSVEAFKAPLEDGTKLIEIKETEKGILDCGAKPGSVITWLKDNETLGKTPSERGDDVHFVLGNGGSILKITEATPADSGIYTCLAAHPEENVTKPFSVSVLSRPYFEDMFPITDFTVKENESITLECPAQGSPTPRINWRLAENNLPVSEHTLPGVSIGAHDNSLSIKSAKPFHSGLYICSAINKLGEERRVLSVKVIGPPKRIGPELIELDVISGSELELLCSIDGTPNPIFKWSFTSRAGESNVLKYISKTIRIGNALTEDDGIYTCLASNDFGSATRTFNVSVIEVPRIKRGVDEKIQLAVGEDYNLKCFCNGRKPMEVKWFFNRNQINSSDVMTMNKFNSSHLEYTYKIVNASKDSQGTYSCVLSNIAGTDQHQFEVEVIAPPKYSKRPKNEKIQLMEGESIHFDCPVESIDAFRIQWKKNGYLMPEFENQTLYIERTTIEDEANYTCIASNFAGWMSVKLEANIYAEPKIISDSNDGFKKIHLDKKLVLNCTVHGNPRPKILWTKNLEQITDLLLPQVVFSEENQILEIDEVDSSDGGKYSCFPSNIIGSAEKHFEVEVIVPPLVEGKNTVLEKQVTVDVFRRAVLRCPFIATPEPKILWFKGSDEIKENDSRFKVSLDKRVLIINHAEESVAGIYKCSAANQVGDNDFIFYLHIRIPMHWSQWSSWQECNVSCGGGVQIRKRECLGDRNEILSEYIHLFNSSCVGPDVDTRECNNHICPVDGGWGSWSEWGACSSSCGPGLRRRSRRCNNPLPAHGGEDCTGETYEDEKCEEKPCPVNGHWGEWSDWNECSATCGPSIKMRTRICNNPAPAYGGLPCSGNSRDIALCKNKECPYELGGWSSWSRWGHCTASCGLGRQIRTRTCIARNISDCIGKNYQVKVCRKPPCQTRRYPRHATLRIHGELNSQEIDQNIEADIIQNNNETSILAVSRNVTNNDTIAYLPLIMSPVSWITAQEVEGGENGLSLTRGKFKENSTYHFSTGEEMDVQSDAQSFSDNDDIRLDIKVQGKAPPSPAATIIINPYTEEIIQTDPNHIKSSSATNLEADGSLIPVSWNKEVHFLGNEQSRIHPVKSLTAKGSKSHIDRKSNQLEFTVNPAVISSRYFRDACPRGFKYNTEIGECSDINECRRRGLNDCLPSQVCINNIGSYTCECRNGFRRNPSNEGCRDINECLEGQHACSHKCQNTRGSYQCLCPKHLILAEDMHNCVAVSDYDYYDGHDDNGHGDHIRYQLAFSSTAPKYEVAPSFRRGKGLFNSDPLSVQQDETNQDSLEMAKVKDILCKSGFHQIGEECEDINECTEEENVCTKEQLCMNTPGSFACIETPCPEHFILSVETRSCLLLCMEEESTCTDGAILSESLQILTVPVYKANYTFHPFTDILELASYDNNDLPLSGSIYEIVSNEAGIPVKIRNDNRIGVLYAQKYFEVTNQEKLILMSSKYDSNGNKLHSTMFVVIIYNIKTPPI